METFLIVLTAIVIFFHLFTWLKMVTIFQQSVENFVEKL